MTLSVIFILSSALLYTASYCLYFPPTENQGFRIATPGFREAEPSLLDFCANYRQGMMSRNIFCIICKGFHPSCFHKSSTTQAPSTTTNNPSTTTSGTTTVPGTTTIPATTPSSGTTTVPVTTIAPTTTTKGS